MVSRQRLDQIKLQSQNRCIKCRKDKGNTGTKNFCERCNKVINAQRRVRRQIQRGE